MAGLALAYVIGGLGLPRLAVGEHDPEVYVLVVHREHTAIAVSEERHAVAVVAEGGLLAFAGASRRVVEGNAARPERVAPAGNHLPAEALRNGDRVEESGGNGREAEARHPGASQGHRHAAGAQHERAHAERSATFQKAAPRDSPLGEPLEISG